MSERKVYHVVPDGDRWKVRREGAERASATADRKEDAIDVPPVVVPLPMLDLQPSGVPGAGASGGTKAMV